MSPVTRSMSRYIRTLQQYWENIREKEIIDEISNGLHNCEIVVGREYKKYIVYALFDYMCDIKDELYLLDKKVGSAIGCKLNEFIRNARKNLDSDKVFLNACLHYQSELSDFIKYSKKRH